MSTLRWTEEALPDGTRRVALAGFITEEADFAALSALGETAPLELDLGEVEQINSCGVREWIHFVRDLDRRGRPFALERCSPAIVRQLNTISNFRGQARIRSVLLPYYCPDCAKEYHELVELPTGERPPAIAEELPCSGCGGTREFDDLPSTYLGFAG